MDAISEGLISYESVYSPDSFIDDQDIDRLSEIINLMRLREVHSLEDEQ